jgi:hypothetical protein
MTDLLILPSTSVRLLHQHYPANFGKLLGADKGLVSNFWQGFLAIPANHRWAQEHPNLRNKTLEELAAMVPLAIHEDAAPCNKTSSVLCKSFSSLIGARDEKVTKLIRHNKIKVVGSDVGDAWKPLLADLESLGSGLVGGEPVAVDGDGTMWCFCLLLAKAD